MQEMRKMHSKATYSCIQCMYESSSVEETYWIFLFPAKLILQTPEESQTKISKKNITQADKNIPGILLPNHWKNIPYKTQEQQ